MPAVVSPRRVAASLTELWSPRVVAEVDEGDAFVVPKGVRHNPVADEECLLLLIERKSTLHTSDVVSERTRTLAEQLRPL
jgi:hypothetical protein